MRNDILWNDNWQFCAPNDTTFIPVTLPHTWNNRDGQDGDGQYLKGKAIYQKSFSYHPSHDVCSFIAFEGAAMVSDVYVNDAFVGHHEGGFSRFCFEITKRLQEGNNVIRVEVDNSVRNCYPQVADFTFYGGIYRDVHLITVDKAHFELTYYGTPGIKVTPIVHDTSADVTVETWQNTGFVEIQVNGETKTTESVDGYACVQFCIDDVHLWNGREDPYLYEAKATLYIDKKPVDEIRTKFGCRTFAIDAQKGFLLNGKEYPLRGVSRHQDRLGIGNALTNDMHDEDFRLIYDMGANSIRLAHYQHAQHFYDLCDQYGMVVWAEIPYISSHMDEGNANTIEQMKDLIIQNYNHPSIVVWGLSNEITLQGGGKGVYDHHVVLNNLVHQLDPTRKSVIADVSFLDIDDPLNQLTDALAYNLYFGWYVEDLNKNDHFFDTFHAQYPTRPIGLSEYGCDTNINFHTSKPTRGDYTEEYQCIYHEHILEMAKSRPWLWCTYAWNMFDFAADARNEGGTKGLNQKGLVSFDRKTKKDAYYLYQAYWSKEPMLHICGKRYFYRNEHEIEIIIYSNLDKVEVYMDEKPYDTLKIDKKARITLPISGKHTIRVEGNGLEDILEIAYVDAPYEDYIFKGEGILNWFDAAGLKEDCYSLEDTVSSLLDVEEAFGILDRIIKTEAKGDGPLLLQARVDINSLRNTKVTVLDLLEQSGNPVSNNVKRIINSRLQNIKKEKV